MNETPYEVIYLTGPPASGKSTLVASLETILEPLKTFVYSKVLAEYLSENSSDKYSQDQTREMSARVITHKDIENVDKRLLAFVAENGKKSHLIIDSHAVTKEQYGFRVTPFSLPQLRKLSPTMIFSLYSEPTVNVIRIKKISQGRPQVSEFEAAFHCELQATVDLAYGINIGIPVYFLVSDRRPSDLANEIACRAKKL
ncbi:MAG: AAA family ATPase [Blastocatellia bacterium]|nr:AAA family ATPase [Blastocatellia bacterium]